MDTIIQQCAPGREPRARGSHAGALGHGPAALVGSLVDVLVTWHQRAAQRRALAMLDDQMLKDIGLTRADVAFEVSRPFWRA